MTIVNRYLRSVNMNSFAPFSLVGESATLPEYKDRRLLMHGDVCAVTDSRHGLPPSVLALPPGHVRRRILTVKMTISTNILMHTGTLNVHQIILSMLMNYYCSSRNNLRWCFYTQFSWSFLDRLLSTNYLKINDVLNILWNNFALPSTAIHKSLQV